MSGGRTWDVAIIGGGIVGLATAMALRARPGRSILVLEAEGRLASHQTGNNSGVIHSGLYYRPGSWKARTCAAGREALYHFCEVEGVRHERCGKVVVAAHAEEVGRLAALEERGRSNGLEGLRRLSPEEIREIEPHAAGIAGLWVPETGIVDYVEVAAAMARRIRTGDAEIRLGSPVLAARRFGGETILETPSGAFACRTLVNCAGLQSDRVARACGADPGLRIVPFRGEYYEIVPARRSLVRSLVYPVPDPRFPFLGVHFTRRVDGGVEAGPNAVLAWAREGYSWTKISLRDTAETLAWPGAWRLFARLWKTGLGETVRSLWKPAFVHALRRLVPEIRGEDLVFRGAGVRAQAVDRSGALLDDFRIVRAPGAIHVLNAPSPAATASIAIGRAIAAMVEAG